MNITLELNDYGITFDSAPLYFNIRWGLVILVLVVVAGVKLYRRKVSKR